MASTVTITIREPPHRAFVQGYPGIPGSSAGGARVPAHISGTVEIRPTRPKGVKAVYVRVELKKLEQIKTASRFKELIGVHPTVLWQSSKPKSGLDEGYDVLSASDFPFKLPLPEGLPPSVIVDRSKAVIGVLYEIVCTMAVKPKTCVHLDARPRLSSCSGLLGSSSREAVTVQESVPIVVEKQNRASVQPPTKLITPVHGCWPIYAHQAALEDRQSESSGVWMCAKRTTTSIGPGDSFVVTVQLRSNRIDPVMLTRLELSLREVVTYRGDLTGAKASSGDQRVREVVETKLVCKQALYSNDLHSFDIRAQLSPQHNLVTVSTAKHISVAYSLRIRAVMDRGAGTTGPVSDVIIDAMPTTVSSRPRQHSDVLMQEMMRGNADPIPPFLDIPGNPSAQQLRSTHHSFASYDPRMSMLGHAMANPSTGSPSVHSHPSERGSLYGGVAPSSRSNSASVTAPNQALYADADGSPGHLRPRTPASVAVEAAKQRLRAHVVNAGDDDAANDDPYGLRDMPDLPPSKLERERLRTLEQLTNATPPSVSVHSPTPPSQTDPVPAASSSRWQTAEEEKARLFQTAVAQRAATTAAPVPAASSPSSAVAPTDYATAEEEKARLYAAATGSGPAPAAAASSSSTTWLSAEEEKRRLHAEAVAARSAQVSNGRSESVDSTVTVSPPRSSRSSIAAEPVIPRPLSVISTAPSVPSIDSASREKAVLAAKYAAESGDAPSDFGVAGSSSVASLLNRSVTYSVEKQRYLEAVAARERAQAEQDRRDRIARPSPPLRSPSIRQSSSYFGSPSLGSVDEHAPADDLPDYGAAPGFSPILGEKERMARHYDTLAQSTSTPPRSSSPDQFEPAQRDSVYEPSLQRRVSTATTATGTSESSMPLRRDPTIALGKKRAVEPVPTPSWPNPYDQQTDAIQRVASPRLYGLATLSPLDDRPAGPPPPRPSKTPLSR